MMFCNESSTKCYKLNTRMWIMLTLVVYQLVLAEIVKRSSEVILEIIDMKNAPRRVIDIAIEIEEDVSASLTFCFLVKCM